LKFAHAVNFAVIPSGVEETRCDTNGMSAGFFDSAALHSE